MYIFSNNILSNTFSMRPKKNININEYKTNINNDIDIDNDNNLKIDINSINLNNISLELALNIVQLQHTKYHEMTHQELITYYNEKIKLTTNLNNILALKIILKLKLKGLKFGISDNTNNNKLQEINKEDEIIINNDELKIQDPPLDNQKNIQNNYFKILQNNNKLQKINKIDNIIINKDELKIQNPHINYSKIIQNNNFKISQNNIMSNNIVSNNIISNNSQANNVHSNYIINNKLDNINKTSAIVLSDFDIDSVIKDYALKKQNGFIK